MLLGYLLVNVYTTCQTYHHLFIDASWPKNSAFIIFYCVE